MASGETPPGAPHPAARPVTHPVQEPRDIAAAQPTKPQGPNEGIQAPPPPTEPVPTPPAPAGGNLAEIWQQILAGLELPSTRMLLSQQASLHRLDDRRAVVRVASNWLTMVQSRQSLLEKAMLLALGSARQVTLEASDNSSANPASSPAAAGPPASPAPVAVAVVPQQSETLQPLAPVAISAEAAKSENQSPVEAKRQQPPSGPAISALQAPAAPILGRLETSTKLLADFF